MDPQSQSASGDTQRRKHKKEKKEKRRHGEDKDVDGEEYTVEEAAEKQKIKRKHEHVDEEMGGEGRNPESGEKKRRRKKGKEIAEVADVGNVSELAAGEPVKKEKKIKRKIGVDSPSIVEDGSAKNEKKQKKSQRKSVFESTKETVTAAVPDDSAASDAEVSAYFSKHSVTVNYGSSAGPNASIPNDLKPLTSFSSVFPRIPEPLRDAISSFKEPTPIQACSWPVILSGKDIVGIAETGSGKTLAFGLPAVSNIVKSRQGKPSDDSSQKSGTKSKYKRGTKAQISVLVLAPTRELAIQTHDTFTLLGAPFGLTSVALFGGVDKEYQRRALVAEDAAMVVGTPGRILDLLNEGACDLSGVTYLVLDEADRMLDKGFENDIRAIIGHAAPAEQRQTLMFSATWPDAVRRLASTFQRSPIRVTVGSDDLTANRSVEQVVEVFDDQREKDSRLASHLRTLKARKGGKQDPNESRILIFVLYKKEAARVEQNLSRQGFSVGGIHGDLSQSARIAALDGFKSGKTQLLVATDVAARGLDIPNVRTVINYSFPLTIEDYIHRIGRTGRAGRSGKSITFFTGDNHERALAGELARVLRESGFSAEPLKKFPMTIKKKTHSVYGAFFRDDIPSHVKPIRMVF